MRRTNPETEKTILSQILLGYAYPDIAQQTGVAVSTIKKIKARNKTRYEANVIELHSWSAEEAKESLQRAYKLLNSRLIAAERGGDSLTIKELLLISNQMLIHEQVSSISASSVSPLQKENDINKLLSKLKKK